MSQLPCVENLQGVVFLQLAICHLVYMPTNRLWVAAISMEFTYCPACDKRLTTCQIQFCLLYMGTIQFQLQICCNMELPETEVKQHLVLWYQTICSNWFLSPCKQMKWVDIPSLDLITHPILAIVKTISIFFNCNELVWFVTIIHVLCIQWR